MKRFFTITGILSLALLSLANASTAMRASTLDLEREVQEQAPRHDYILQLLAHGSNPNITVNGCPLVIYVTMKLVRKKTTDHAKWFEVLRTLLKKKAHVDELDTNYHTALMYAAYYGHYDAAALLLSHHAKADFCNERGESPISQAHAGHKLALTETEKQRYVKIIALLSSAILKR